MLQKVSPSKLTNINVVEELKCRGWRRKHPNFLLTLFPQEFILDKNEDMVVVDAIVPDSAASKADLRKVSREQQQHSKQPSGLMSYLGPTAKYWGVRGSLVSLQPPGAVNNP